MKLQKESPLFSILVANFNNGRFFRDCYTSIVNQTYSNWEVVIVDDGSTDDSVEIIKKIIGDDSRFILSLNDFNRGCGYTKRKCAELAQGDILGFLDPDDALYSNALEVMVLTHFKYEDVGLITSKFDRFDKELNFLENGNHGEIIPKHKSFLTFEKGAMTHFATFKNEVYQKTQGINPELKRAVDQDLYLKLEEKGKTKFLDEYLYMYRNYDGGISQNNNDYKAQYWRFVAVLDAYKRRKSTDVDNLSRNEIKLFKSKFYLSRSKKACQEKKYCVKYFFLVKSIIVHFKHKWRYKLKSLVIFNYS